MELEADMQYKIHYDHPNGRWNVFEVLRGHEVYIRSFETLAEARSFCEGK